MRVLIDCRFAGIPTGLGRYSRELVAALVPQNPDMACTLLVRDASASWLQGIHAQILQADIPHYSLAEQRLLPSLIRRSGAELFFSPHFNVPWLCPVPFVATIHDLILHRYPNSASLFKRAAYRILLHRTVRKARRLIAVSDFTREEIARAYGSRTLQKTVRIHEGVPPQFVPCTAVQQQAARETYGLSRTYVLYVGNSKEHKNVQLLIDAFAEADVADMELVLITGGPEAQRLHLAPQVRILGGVPDADLPALYSAAAACVTASLYEGFGLPVLEALHCGCPVIASDRTAIPEVADGHALLIPPYKEEFVEAFRSLPQKRPSLPDRWTWEETARQTALVLRDALRDY